MSNWYKRHTSDQFVKKANKEGQRSRAAYKLLEIQNKRQIINKGSQVLDLGSAPGAWSETLVDIVGPQGIVVACDLLPMQPISGVAFIQGDFLDTVTQENIQKEVAQFDVIVSDMAPNLTGQAVTDQANMYELIENAMGFAEKHLKIDGVMLVKSFSGALQNDVMVLFKSHFKTVKTVKPEASRSGSKEIYLIGEGFKV